MPLDYYCHQTINKLKKLLEQEDAKIILKMAIPILPTIGIYIGLTKFLEVSLFNVKYNLKKRLCEGYTNVDKGDDDKIKEAITADNNKDDNKMDF